MPRCTEDELDDKLEGMDCPFHTGPAHHPTGLSDEICQPLHLSSCSLTISTNCPAGIGQGMHVCRHDLRFFFF